MIIRNILDTVKVTGRVQKFFFFLSVSGISNHTLIILRCAILNTEQEGLYKAY